MNQAITKLLSEVVNFNLQLHSKASGEESRLHEAAMAHISKRIEPLTDIGLTADLLVQESFWTWLDDEKRLCSLTRFDRPCTCCHLYTACLRLMSPNGPLWLSQLLVGADSVLHGIRSYFYDGFDYTDAMPGKKVFISYTRKRYWLAFQIRVFFESLGLTVFDYLKQGQFPPRDDDLHERLKEQIDSCDAFLAIDDHYARMRVMAAMEVLHATRESRSKVIPVLVSDHHIFNDSHNPNPYEWNHFVVFCTCHWPERLREITAWLAYILKSGSVSGDQI